MVEVEVDVEMGSRAESGGSDGSGGGCEKLIVFFSAWT